MTQIGNPRGAILLPLGAVQNRLHPMALPAFSTHSWGFISFFSELQIISLQILTRGPRRGGGWTSPRFRNVGLNPSPREVRRKVRVSSLGIGLRLGLKLGRN